MSVSPRDVMWEPDRKEDKVIKWLLLAFFFFVPYVRLFYFPVVSAKIQPTEIIFLFLFPVALYRYGRRLIPESNLFKIALAVYLGANLLSGVVAGSVNSILESLGRVYLVVLALIVAQFVQSGKVESHNAEKLVQAWSAGAIVMAVLTIIGYAAAVNGYLNQTVVVYENYPYFGTVIRAKGLTGGANSLAYVSMIPLLYLYRRIRNGKSGKGWLVLLVTVCLLTISKEFVLILLGCFLIDPWVMDNWRKLRPMAVVGISLFLWFGTHLIVQRPNDVKGSYLEGTEYTSENVFWKGDNVQLLETSYLALKKAGISVGKKHPLLGVGPGEFNKYLPEEKAKGVYPDHLPDYDPHSTWVGAFSETGWLGLLGIILLTVSAWISIVKNISVNSWTQNDYMLPVGVSILLILIASVSLDIMNFRYLWAPFGILIGVMALNKPGQVVR
ncbi:O-antigen ligase family protein [Neolewinella agarilytica]|uniref:O-antigen ligase n=1 Tax=Neolewinella agarilytica TaxID=478744 RepID=A0A1H9DZB8_9BACT|nr:O-antigen ligase family protein [Neolewinella agarilytica]SEQ18830.1 O-antigen ligase [Neolewinella agarilytica]